VSLRKDGATRVISAPFRRLLVANRGEIALRVFRACAELGIGTVAVYSEADRRARHVEAADVAVEIGPAAPADSYLRADRIIQAALETGAEAIHPGYGFLAERASFAAAVEAAGLTFIGPRSETIRALGDKLAARRLASVAGVPVVPGTLEPATIEEAGAVERLVETARGIGLPLLVKAAAGGGGRGMRRVDRLDDLAAAITAAAREAAAAFGDGAVYLERAIEPARHIEVQLIGDRRGRVVAIGERDCSVQRRHQKLVEESPAPGLTDAERRDVLALARRLAEAAELVNAATAEFLFDADRRFWFLEVNTRLQVEHGVSELVADVDLVREQILVASGRPLGRAIRAAARSAARPRRHAIEVRISAEDPAQGFAPTPGRVGVWRVPGGPGIRVDDGIRPGDDVAPDYDPLVAKILVVDADRPAAVARLSRALDELEVSGIQTTLPFDRWLVRDPAFGAGGVSTAFVAERWQPVALEERARALAAAMQAAAAIAQSGVRIPGRVEAPTATGDSVPRSTTGPDGSAPVHGRAGGLGGWRAAGRVAGADRWPR
jgi:acetyl/propionyl-CoA carboxylase alpha subunit